MANNRTRYLRESEILAILEESSDDEAVDDVSDEDSQSGYEHVEAVFSDVEEVDSEEEMDTELELLNQNGEFCLSKDKQIKWFSSPQLPSSRNRSENIMRQRPGITSYAAQRIDTNMRSAYDVCFTSAMVNIVIENSNLEGRRVFGNSWESMDEDLFDAYIGLCILSGVYRSHGEALESLWDELNGRPIFRATMPMRTFQNISRVLRFDDKSTRAQRRETDKLAAIRELFTMWQENLGYLYVPHENVTIDEQLVAFRGRCPFRQFMPSKPARYGLKNWIMADSQSYFVSNLQPYLGKLPDQRPERGQGQRVVLDLVGSLEGRNITCDNFFTTHELATELLKRKNTMVGTVRQNKTFLPVSGTAREMRTRALNSSKFYFDGKVALVQYVPKKYKVVTVLSTLHNTAKVVEGPKNLPEMIQYYNKTKCGVDTVDQLVQSYTVKRKTNRWPMAFFHNIIDLTCLNAFILYNDVNAAWSTKLNRRRVFLESLGKELIKKHKDRRSIKRGSDTLVGEPVSSNSTSRRCDFCPRQKDRKTSTFCEKCKKALCREHKVTVNFCSLCCPSS